MWVATPLYDEGEFIEILEIGTSFTSFLEEVKNHLGGEVGLFVKNRSDAAGVILAGVTNPGLVGNVIQSLHLPEGLVAPLRQVVLARRQTYQVTMIPLRGFSQAQEGALALISDVTTVTRLLHRNTISLIGFLLAAILIFILTKKLEAHSETLEAQVQERTRELEQVNQHKSQFLANMSHELQTPLNAVIGFSELLEDQKPGPLNEKQLRYVHHIWTSGKHLLNLIKDILDLSKVEAGKIEMQPEPFSLSEALQAALSDIRPQADAKGLELVLNGEPCPATLVADPTRFKQVLFNLLSNAVKFTPEGGQVMLAARQVEDTFVEIAVKDTGIGIKAEEMPKLFQEFSQLDSSLIKRHQGTGLGLALTKRLVELHGGTIRAESPGGGEGTTFTIRLPLSPPTN